MRRGGPHKGMIAPMGRGPGQGPARDGQGLAQIPRVNQIVEKRTKSLPVKKEKRHARKKDASKSGVIVINPDPVPKKALLLAW